jgi:type IV pilus assembly protein PilP
MRVSRIAVLFASVVVTGACGGDKVTSAPPSAPPARAASPGPVVAAVEARPSFSDGDFTENDHNRDPFRSFASLFVPPPDTPSDSQLKPILPQYAIDELKLVAIVLSGDYPRAMVTDPTGKGWVVKPGDYVGRPEIVHVGGSNGSDFQMNWRVERVREGEVVLAREDRAKLAQSAIKVLPLKLDEGDREQRL